MALPKRRHSRRRGRLRRTHLAQSPPPFYTCPNCGQAKRPHCVCGNCGYYGGKKVVEVKET